MINVLAVITKNSEESLELQSLDQIANIKFLKKMPRRRSKPLIPEFEKIDVAAQYYSDQLRRLYHHNPQLVSRVVEDLYVAMLYVNENFADAEHERKQNELVQKEGR